jgi:hypothetical protein
MKNLRLTIDDPDPDPDAVIVDSAEFKQHEFWPKTTT